MKLRLYVFSYPTQEFLLDSGNLYLVLMLVHLVPLQKTMQLCALATNLVDGSITTLKFFGLGVAG